MSEFLPNSFQTPNAYIDRFMHLLTAEEWKVLSYAARRIFGFGKRQDRISLSQFTGGVVDRKAGRRLDYGTGLSLTAVKHALSGLTRYGLLLEIESGSVKTNTAALYELQLDSERVDLAGLQARADERHTTNTRRTGRARTKLGAQRAPQSEPLLSDSTGQTSIVGQNRPLLSDSTASIVGQNRPLLSDSTDLYCGTEEQYPVGKPVENQMIPAASFDAPAPPVSDTPPAPEPAPAPPVRTPRKGKARAAAPDTTPAIIREALARECAAESGRMLVRVNTVAKSIWARQQGRKPPRTAEQTAAAMPEVSEYLRTMVYPYKDGQPLTPEAFDDQWVNAAQWQAERRRPPVDDLRVPPPPPDAPRRLSPKEAAARVRELEAARTTGGTDAPRAPV